MNHNLKKPLNNLIIILATKKVTGCNLYITTKGSPAIAASTVIVPDAAIPAPAFCSHNGVCPEVILRDGNLLLSLYFS